MSQHTPGECLICGNSPVRSVDTNAGSLKICEPCEVKIKNGYRPNGIELTDPIKCNECEADLKDAGMYGYLATGVNLCQFHAAAPDLLAACHAFCRTMAFTPTSIPDAFENDINAAYEMARAAIRKAEGESRKMGADE